MFLLLLVLFIGLPIAEIALLIEVGGALGLWPTLAACVGTAVVGAWLARTQGASVLRQVQRRLARGEVPAGELIDGLLIAVAGVLLLTPGFVTDAVGLLALLPPTRALIRGAILRQLTARAARPVWVARGSWAEAPPPWADATGWDARPPERQAQPAVELLPPAVAPRHPKPPPPDVIDVD